MFSAFPSLFGVLGSYKTCRRGSLSDGHAFEINAHSERDMLTPNTATGAVQWSGGLSGAKQVDTVIGATLEMLLALTPMRYVFSQSFSRSGCLSISNRYLKGALLSTLFQQLAQQLPENGHADPEIYYRTTFGSPTR